MSDGTFPPAGADPGDVQKWEFLKRAPARDSTQSEIVAIAHHLIEAVRLSPWREYAFAQLALAMARDCIAYELDSDRVGREQIDGYTDLEPRADRPFVRGVDDCDGKARFFTAICLAGGLKAEMIGRWKRLRLAHVYARVWCKGPHGEPHWWTAETILRRARLGDVAEQVPKEIETGKWSQ